MTTSRGDLIVKRMKSFAALLGLLLMTSVASQAATITTLFATNNGGSNGGAVYFDLTVGANPITITAFETNTAVTVAFDWTVYLIGPGGTYSGNEGNSGAWSQVATGSGIGQGTDNPTTVTLDNTFSLLANSTYGIALVMGSTAEPPIHERQRLEPELLERRPFSGVRCSFERGLRRRSV